MLLYRTLCGIARPVLSLMLDLRVVGRRNVPPEGPFLLVSNHQSLLDPVIIQSFCPRILHTMAKSGQFAAPVIGWVMARGYAFPVRRYQIDPQAVRHVLRCLDAGEAVGIYVEGERAWDGRLQPPRRGTLRLILWAGVPVVPVTMDGAYDAWPRWAGRPRRARVTVTFGEPLSFPRIRNRADREAMLDATARTLMAAIAAPLGGEVGPASPAAPTAR